MNDDVSVYGISNQSKFITVSIPTYRKQDYIAKIENKGESLVKLHKKFTFDWFDIHKTQSYNGVHHKEVES